MGFRFRYYGEVLVRLLPVEDYALHLEALAEALPIEVAATDATGRVIVWNEAMAAVAGPRAAALGRPLLEAVPWIATDPNVNWAAELADVIGGGETRSFPRQPLGQRVVRATLGPMRGPGGEPLGAVLALEDITPGARAEVERRRQERARFLHDLGAGIAHEVRNPLNALSLNLQLLQERIEDPSVDRDEVLRRTEKMIAETKRVEVLVQHLLEVSRGGGISPSNEKIDPVVARVVDDLEGLAESRGCEVEVTAGSDRMLPLDRVRIERALHNLLRNAIDAAAEGGGHVWVVTRDDPHSTVVVIDDDGPGIRPEDRSRVFVLYSTGKRGGTGLGLPLAQEDIMRHGGEIEVLSRPGGGARFVIHLPPRPDEEATWHES